MLDRLRDPLLRCLTCGVSILILSLAGCPSSQHSGLAPVNGIVKAKGIPLSSGKIMFYPDGGGRPAMGAISSDGRFELTTYKEGDGALIGTHHVTILAMSASEDGQDIFDRTKHKISWLIPEKFSDHKTTTLTAVVDNSANEIEFDSAEFK